MAGIKTVFIDGKSLFFTLRTQDLLYRSCGVSYQTEYMKKVFGKTTGKDGTGVVPEDYYNFIYHALLFENKSITMDEVIDLVETWQLDGLKDQNDLDLLVYETLTNSGMYPKALYEQMKKYKGMTEEEFEAFIKAEVAKKSDPGEDKGESLKS